MPDVLADASVLITLDNIGRLDLLREMYGSITITPEVSQEFGDPLPEWVKAQAPNPSETVRALSAVVDQGEASLIALALECKNPLILLDDLKARKLATRLDLRFSGLLGVLLKAKQNGILPAVRPLLNDLKAKRFRLSSDMEQTLLKLAGEQE